MRRLLVPLLLALGLLALPAPASAEGEGGTLVGTIDGEDGRAVNALLGFDFLDAQGRRLHRSGCVQGPDCPLTGYASVLRVNQGLPADGSPDRDAHTTTWSVGVPAGTAQVFLEVYPQNASLRTDEARYGHAMRHGIRIPYAESVDLRLPLTLCGEGGTVGSVSGTATKDGQPHPVRRLVAWSLEGYDRATRPVLGWNIGTARADGTFTVPNLVPDQRYQVWLTAEDGTVRKTFGVVPQACADTSIGVSFDPPPAQETPPPSAPTVETPLITSGQEARLSGGAGPGQTVELWAYSRPSTEYRLVRTTTANASGFYAFTVQPPTSTRLRVRIAGRDSDSSVVQVRTVVSMGITRLGPRTYRFAGGTRPAFAGRRVDVLIDGRVAATAYTNGDGRWSLDRRFLGTGTFGFSARVHADAQNAEGRSAVRRLAVS